MKLGVYKQLNKDGETVFRQLTLYDFETGEWIAGVDGVVRSLPAEPVPEDFDKLYGGRRSRRIVAEPGDLDGPIKADASEPSEDAIKTAPTATEQEILEWGQYMDEHGTLPEHAIPDGYEPRSAFADKFNQMVDGSTDGAAAGQEAVQDAELETDGSPDLSDDSLNN